MKVGFTGTSRGMSAGQCYELKQLLSGDALLPDRVTELHHGMCVGADCQGNEIARELSISTVGHPPVNKSKYYGCVCNQVRPQKEYLARNKNIVNETDLLFIGPDWPEYLRSGTWSTK